MKRLAITGVSRGLGWHLAELALRQGYEVVGIGRTRPAGLVLHPKFHFVEADFEQPSAVGQILRAIVSHGKLPTYWILNAAVIENDVEGRELLVEKYRKTIRVNLDFNVNLIETVGPLLSSSGGGTIGVVASLSGIRPVGAKGLGYPMSKAGLISYVEAQKHEGVRFITILPGLMQETGSFGRSLSYDRCARKILSAISTGTRKRLYLPRWKYMALRLSQLLP